MPRPLHYNTSQPVKLQANLHYHNSVLGGTTNVRSSNKYRRAAAERYVNSESYLVLKNSFPSGFFQVKFLNGRSGSMCVDVCSGNTMASLAPRPYFSVKNATSRTLRSKVENSCRGGSYISAEMMSPSRKETTRGQCGDLRGIRRAWTALTLRSQKYGWSNSSAGVGRSLAFG